MYNLSTNKPYIHVCTSSVCFRIIQNRLLLVGLAIVFVTVIGIIIYFATRKTSS